MGDIRVILTVDGLSAPYLGPYGGSWVATPGINRLASQGCVWDNGIATTLDVQNNVLALWSSEASLSESSLFEQYESFDYETVLIHDEKDWLCDVDVPGEIVEIRLAESTAAESTERPASSLSETRMAILFGAVLEQLESDSNLLIWVHSRGMFNRWDAPAEFVQSVLDEDDPIPPRYAVPPQRWVEDDEDPDILLGIRQSYAAQVAVLDACIETLLDHPRLQTDSSEFYLIGLRGYPLGEHGYIGISDETPLYGESLTIPVIAKNRAVTKQRWRGLTSLSDLHGLLLPRVETPYPLSAHKSVCVRHGEQVVLRTDEWMMREADGVRQLFAKPDDRFECNDVADIMGEVVDEIGETG